MTQNTLQQWMSHPELLNRETLYELRVLLARYPHFQLLYLLYLKNLYLLRDAHFNDELRKSVVFVADRRRLFSLIEESQYDLSLLTPAPAAADEHQELTDRTLELINAFLSTSPEDTSEEPASIDVATDYTTYLMSEYGDSNDENTPRLQHQDLIDNYIAENTGQPQEENGPQDYGNDDETLSDDALDDSYFTETLAKIYLKQLRYDKALVIIKRLSLKYPKKSVYFADQIKTIEDIINAKSK